MRPSVVRYHAPGWGTGVVWLDGERVLCHEPPKNGDAAGDAPPPHDHPLAHRLAAWFGGASDDFGDVDLDLDGLTPFSRNLADAIRTVPRGTVVTYGELAALAGRPGAARAAGTFCARNDLPVFLPCHRVVAAGGIGGYGSSGIAYKRRLLALEDVSL